MKKLHFDYCMQIAYSEVVSVCHFTIKCFPMKTLRQEVESTSIELYPAVTYSTGEDSFGNRQIYGENTIPHDTFQFHITGDVRTGLAGWEKEDDGKMTAVFRHPHGLNVAGEALYAYHVGLKTSLPAGNYEKGIYLMNRLYHDFAYEKGCTGMDTTAEQAWKLGRGVCQDYAHIMIALLHREGIPARYVTGMMIGEGASHAWVELCHEGKWYGLDPTNNAPAGDDYIRIGCGRDAADCLINRGIMHGGGNQMQTVRVSVTETDF